MSAPPVEIHDVTVAYHRKPVLWDIDLDVPEGKLVGIIGPNGAGKTTLIKAVLGLVPLASGKIEIYGKPYRQQRHLIGYVPQRESVDWDFPVTVLDVALMGTYGRLGWCRRPGRTERDQAMNCLEQVGMAHLARRQIRQLSGGQQQRVAIARAIVADPKLLVCDEPTGDLDRETADEILGLLEVLNQDHGKTIIIVTHDPKAAGHAKQILHLDKGKLVEEANL